MTNDVCNCYDNWGVGLSHHSGDCSERICPYELAWVDTPDKKGSFHKYAECSGRGICDRATGECACFDGYEGKACARTTCPTDCSGHGTCEYIENMPWESANLVTTTTAANLNSAGFAKGVKGTQISESRKSNYYQWDAGKIRGCVCDARYGDVDCSKRICPYGTDVLDVRDDLTQPQKYQMQELTFVADDESFNVYSGPPYLNSKDSSGIYSTGLKGQTFALTFRSRLNESFTTIPIVFDPIDLNDFVHDVQVALLTLPNRVIDGVTVSAGRYLTSAASYDGNGNPNSIYAGSPDIDGNTFSATSPQFYTRNEIRVNVTFTGPSVQGPQHLLKIESYECQSGCTPKLSGLRLQTRANHLQSNTTEIVLADFNSYECGRRGKCDCKFSSSCCRFLHFVSCLLRPTLSLSLLLTRPARSITHAPTHSLTHPHPSFSLTAPPNADTSGLCSCFVGYTGEACGTLTTLV